MRGYWAFTKKELLESVKTYKILIMLSVFLFFGLMSPLAAKYMPEIANSFLPENFIVELSAPVALDSWAQFFKNMSQIGLIVLVITFCNTMANEFTRGTLVNLLTKGLSRKSVVLSKFTAAAIIWTISYFLAFIVAYVYTQYFWRHDFMLVPLLFAVLCLWFFGILLLAVVVSGGAMFNTIHGTLLFTITFILLITLVGAFPELQKYTPVALIMDNLLIMQSEVPASDYFGAIIVSICLSILTILQGCFMFEKKVL